MVDMMGLNKAWDTDGQPWLEVAKNARVLADRVAEARRRPFHVAAYIDDLMVGVAVHDPQTWVDLQGAGARFSVHTSIEEGLQSAHQDSKGRLYPGRKMEGAGGIKARNPRAVVLCDVACVQAAMRPFYLSDPMGFGTTRATGHAAMQPATTVDYVHTGVGKPKLSPAELKAWEKALEPPQTYDGLTATQCLERYTFNMRCESAMHSPYPLTKLQKSIASNEWRLQLQLKQAEVRKRERDALPKVDLMFEEWE